MVCLQARRHRRRGDGVAVVGQRHAGGAVEEHDAVRDDFRAVFSLAFRGVPGARLDSTFHVYFTSLLEELAALLGELPPGDDGEPLGLFLAFAVGAAVGAAGGDAEIGEGGAVCGVAHLGVRSEVADDHDFIQAGHLASPSEP